MMITAWPNVVGYLAASLLLLTFFMQKMVALRSVALMASAAWLVYGWADHIYPVVALHTVLLPLNGVRLAQALRPRPATVADVPAGSGAGADWPLPTADGRARTSAQAAK